MDSETFIALVKHEENFKTLYMKNRIESFRKDVFDFLLSRKTENEYFVIQDKTEGELKQICNELSEAGWKTTLSYGDTGLFVYRNKTPDNCW